jgi:RNA polymerase sigma-B factor
MARRKWKVRYLLDPELDEALQNEAEPKAYESTAERRKRMARRLSASLTKGRWFCEACNCWHESPTKGGPVCPNEYQREYKDAINSIEYLLAYAFGQRGEVAGKILSDTALDLECGRWGTAARDRYRNHPQLGEYTTRAAEFIVAHAAKRKAPPHGLSLSEAQAKLVSDHLPLVRKLARQFARSDALFDGLEAHGVETLTGLVRRYDAARGATFGAFAKPHLLGAMRDYIRHRPCEIAVDDPEKIDAAIAFSTRKLTPKPKKDGSRIEDRIDEPFAHDSAGGAADRRREELSNLTERYFASGGIIKRRTPALTEEVQRALERLNPRQRAVYQARRLTDPPEPREKVARRLGIRDSTQISRIQRQAENRIAKMLNAKVSSAQCI